MIPDDGGNYERVGIIYDKRAVVPTGLATAVNPPRRKHGEEYVPEFTWWRMPYMASFRSGNFDFVAVTAHIRWGESAGRLKELQSFTRWLELKRAERNVVDKDLIVTGDFNIASKAMLDALTAGGLVVPRGLRKADLGTTLETGKRYDHILHLPLYAESFMNLGGVLDFYCGDHEALFPGMSFPKFKQQMSDHFPLWVQINTDNDDQHLDQVLRGGRD